MNNNSWQRMSPFARPSRYDLGPVSQPPAERLFPVEQLMGGGGMSASAMMPQQQMPQQQIPQQYSQGQPTGKKILGMPKDRFIALMGTIAQAFGGDSASGRMGAGLVNMADIMHGERMAQGERQVAEAETRRKAAAQTAKEKREAATKKKGKAPTVRTFRVDDMDVQHSFNYDTRTWEPIPGMKGKKVKETEEKKKAPTIRTFRIGDKDVQHAWDLDTGEWKPIPGMPGKKVEPPAGEKPAMTEAKARKGIVDIAKYRQKLKTSGGMDETLFYLIQKNNPDLAKEMQGADRDKLEEVLGEHEEWLRTFIPGEAKKAKSFGSSDAPEGATATNPTTGERIITKNGEWVLQE